MKPQEYAAPKSVLRVRVAATVSGLIAIVLGGVVHGQFTHRWGGGADVAAAAAVLDRFPEAFGVWRRESDDPMDGDVLDTLQCSNYVRRTYLNSETSEKVRVAVIVGPAGPTAVHTPEICYSSRAFAIDQSRTKQSIKSDAALHMFWKTVFKSRQPGGPRLIAYYGWSDGSAWEASEMPRYQFGGSPFLYKIQLAGEPLMDLNGEQRDLCYRFLEDLIDSGWATSVSN
ncbi:hypothetical protein KOR34_36220 [Posidoniimonas corsicana]|uniref:Methanolan biosynthesis EpsI domain-containing protein n=1 Tax=Posidoniimonas corsicana TaxID=1938618 RepID=A0A5C5V5F8_9BACT|nr:hypothetical protein KOR34_36220 [Posidoniimonas corsicana]